MKPLIIFSKVAFSIVMIIIVTLVFNDFKAQDLPLQIFVFVVLCLGLFISIKEKETEVEEEEIAETLDEVSLSADNLIDMINHSKKIEDLSKTFMGQQTIKPYECQGFLDWQKTVCEDEVGFYWGNCVKAETKNEISQLMKFKPRLIEKFVMGTTAYDIHGNQKDELLPIYFTVKKESLK